jgi:hypothetical protein
MMCLFVLNMPQFTKNLSPWYWQDCFMVTLCLFVLLLFSLLLLLIRFAALPGFGQWYFRMLFKSLPLLGWPAFSIWLEMKICKLQERSRGKSAGFILTIESLEELRCEIFHQYFTVSESIFLKNDSCIWKFFLKMSLFYDHGITKIEFCIRNLRQTLFPH